MTPQCHAVLRFHGAQLRLALDWLRTIAAMARHLRQQPCQGVAWWCVQCSCVVPV